MKPHIEDCNCGATMNENHTIACNYWKGRTEFSDKPKQEIKAGKTNIELLPVDKKCNTCGLIDLYTPSAIYCHDCMGSLENYKEHDPVHDPVNHPSHYCSHPSGIECIEITRHHGFAVGNAMKYMWRAGLKDPSPEKEIEDLKKAIWYLQDRIDQLTKKNQNDPTNDTTN